MHLQFTSFVRTHTIAFALLLLVGWGNSLVWARDINRAVNAYKQGYSLFFQQKYSLSLQYFLLSYRSLPKRKRYNKTRAQLNYFIGMCHFHTGSKRDAYAHLNAYLTATESKQKARDGNQFDKAKRITIKLQREFQLGQVHVPPVRRRTIQPPNRRQVSVIKRRPPPTITPKRPHVGGWVIAGIGLAALATAIVVGIAAQQTMDGANATFEQQKTTARPQANEVTPQAQSALTQSTVANALYIAGGTLTGLGAILLLTWQVPTSP